tara:strand:+ start:390 stop:593 length:204 start_codon:yes stop_codon:yes gene_type:complete
LGESGFRERSAIKVFFGAILMPFPFHINSINSPKKLTPEERLRRYVEQKYGRMDVQKKKERIVEKKS